MAKKIIALVALVLAVALGAKLGWDYYFGGGRFDKQMHEVHDYMNAGRYEQARHVLEPIADEYWVAKWNLALLYAGGLGVEFDKEKTLELLKSLDQSDRPRPSNRPCNEPVADIAMDAKWVANELRPIDSGKATQWDQIATEMGFDHSKCPGIPAK